MKTPVKIDGKLRLIKNKVLVEELEFGVKKTANGLLIPDDDMKDRGIRPRWGKVYDCGPDVEDIKPGQYVLLKHGRWTRGIVLSFEEEIKKVWMIDYPDAVLLISNDRPKVLDQVAENYKELVSR